MKISQVLPLFAVVVLLAGCASSSSSNAPAPLPTPANQRIDVLSANHLPDHYRVVGTVRGSTIQMLQNRARKLGADAIINPRSVDPVSGWATTQAIKYEK